MLKSALNIIKSPFLVEKVNLTLRETERNKLFRRGIVSRNLHTSIVNRKAEDRRMMIASLPPKDEGTEGEKLMSMDSVIGTTSLFPDENTPNVLFNGVPFKDLPICNIRVTPNNTILSVTDSSGVIKLMHSAGREGFKNAKKGTNLAAQASAITISTRAVQRGIETVRVRVQGIGPGRMSAIKGLEMGGFNIVSVTDSTRVSWNPPRPRKAKKL